MKAQITCMWIKLHRPLYSIMLGHVLETHSNRIDTLLQFKTIKTILEIKSVKLLLVLSIHTRIRTK